MLKLFLFSVFQFFSFIYGQSIDSISLSGKIVFFKYEYLKGHLYGFKSQKIIKSFDITNGEFNFRIPNSIEPGIYRILYSEEINESFTDVIINGEEREILFQVLNCNDQPNFLISFENQLWYDYLKNTNKKVEMLNKLFVYLSEFTGKINVNQLLRVYQKERKMYYAFFSKFIRRNNGTLALKMIENKPYFFSDLKKPPIVRDFIRLDYYWDGIDTCNINLLNSPLYFEHIETYLDKVIKSTVNNTSFQRINIINKSIEKIKEKFSQTEHSKDYALKYLMNYFSKRKEYEGMITQLLK